MIFSSSFSPHFKFETQDFPSPASFFSRGGRETGDRGYKPPRYQSKYRGCFQELVKEKIRCPIVKVDLVQSFYGRVVEPAPLMRLRILDGGEIVPRVNSLSCHWRYTGCHLFTLMMNHGFEEVSGADDGYISEKIRLRIRCLLLQKATEIETVQRRIYRHIVLRDLNIHCTVIFFYRACKTLKVYDKNSRWRRYFRCFPAVSVFAFSACLDVRVNCSEMILNLEIFFLCCYL